MADDFFVISCFLGGWRNYHALNDNKYSLVSVKVVNQFGNTWFLFFFRFKTRFQNC